MFAAIRKGGKDAVAATLPPYRSAAAAVAAEAAAAESSSGAAARLRLEISQAVSHKATADLPGSMQFCPPRTSAASCMNSVNATGAAAAGDREGGAAEACLQNSIASTRDTCQTLSFVDSTSSGTGSLAVREGGAAAFSPPPSKKGRTKAGSPAAAFSPSLSKKARTKAGNDSQLLPRSAIGTQNQVGWVLF